MSAFLDFSNRSGFSVKGPFPIKGTCPDFSGYPSSGMVDAGEIGIKLYNSDDYSIERVNFENIKGNGLEMSNPTTTSCWNPLNRGSIRDLSFRNCYRGFYSYHYGEYKAIENLMASECQIAYEIASGNVALVSAIATHCNVALKISGDTSLTPNNGNNSHGIISGGQFNHNTYNLVCHDVALGETLNACHFIGGLAGSDQGVMQIIRSVGVKINGGQISYTDITVDATSQLSLRGVTFRGPVNVTVASGGQFDSSGAQVMTGASLTLNGNAWYGSA